jgi:hypothetical protein
MPGLLWRHYNMALRLFVDFQNSDPQGRVRLVRLNTVGTLKDLADSETELEHGVRVELYDGEMHPLEGVAEYSPEERIWVAVVDWKLFRPSATQL